MNDRKKVIKQLKQQEIDHKAFMAKKRILKISKETIVLINELKEILKENEQYNYD